MDFHLPFPSLKHLTMVCIGKVTLDKEIQPLKKLEEVDDDNNMIYTFEVEKIVTPLEIPAILKHELSDVITGMFRQVERSLLLYDCEEFQFHEQRILLLYDVHGRLDLATMWRRLFDSKVSELNLLNLLLDLLNFTISEEMWYGLDAIVSKILSVACRDADVSFKERELVSRTNRKDFAFVYRFRNSRTATSCLKKLQKLFHRHECVVVDKKGLHVSLDPHRRLPFQFCGDYFDRRLHYELQNEKEKVLFTSEILLNQNSETIINIFKWLPQEEQLKCFHLVSDIQQVLRKDGQDVDVFCRMLDTFLEWPLTHFFLPFLKVALPTMSTHEVFTFLSDIQKKIPERGRLGVLYGDLFEKYWLAIPGAVMAKFALARGCDMDGCDHMAVLIGDIEQFAKKNGYLSERIWDDICFVLLYPYILRVIIKPLAWLLLLCIFCYFVYSFV